MMQTLNLSFTPISIGYLENFCGLIETLSSQNNCYITNIKQRLITETVRKRIIPLNSAVVRYNSLEIAKQQSSAMLFIYLIILRTHNPSVLAIGPTASILFDLTRNLSAASRRMQ